jgi:hypothetical protein
VSSEIYTINIETVYRDAGANAGLQNLTRTIQQTSSAAASLQNWLSGRNAGPGLISVGGGFGRGIPGMPQAGGGAGGGIIPPVSGGGPGAAGGGGGGVNAAAQGAERTTVAVNRLGQALTALQRSRSARIAITGLESVQAASGAVTGLISGLNALRFYAAMGVSAYAISQPFNTYAQRQRQQGVASTVMRGNTAGGAAFMQNINQLATQSGLGDQMRSAALTMLGPAQNVRPATAASFTEENARKVAALSLAYGMDPNTLAQMVAGAMTGRRVFTPEMAEALEARGIPVYDIIAAGLNAQSQQAGRPNPGLSRAGVMSMLREGVLPGIATSQAVLDFANDPTVARMAEQNRRDAMGTKDRAIAALGDISASWGEAVAATLVGPLEQLARGDVGGAFRATLPELGPINRGGQTGGGALAMLGLYAVGGGLLSRRMLRQEFGGVSLGRRVGQTLGIIPRGRPGGPRGGGGGGGAGGAAGVAAADLTAGMTVPQSQLYSSLTAQFGEHMPAEVAAAAARGDIEPGLAIRAAFRAQQGSMGEMEALIGAVGGARGAATVATEAGAVARAAGGASRLSRIMRGGGRVGGALAVAGLALGAADILTTRQAEAAGLEPAGSTARATGENVVGSALPIAAGMVNPMLGLGVGGVLTFDQMFMGGKMTQDLGRRLAPLLSFMNPQQDQINDQMRDITNLNDPYIKEIMAATSALRDLVGACRAAAACLGRCPGGGGSPVGPSMPFIPAGPPIGTMGPGFDPRDPSTWGNLTPRIPGQTAPLPGVAGGLVTSGSWADQARAAATAAGINPDIFVRQMSQESAGFSPDVIAGSRLSSAGARGIAQFMPGTAAGVAKKLGVTLDQFWADPNLQLKGAAMEDSGYSNWRDALVAYNAGPGRVGLPNSQLPGETQSYLQDILGNTPGNTPVAAPQVNVNVSMNNTFTNPADNPDTVKSLGDQIIGHINDQLGQVDTGTVPGPALIGAPIA